MPLLTKQVLWPQQDGAPSHFGRQVAAFPKQHFPDRWFGRGGPVTWPARSPHLSALDYFHWDHMKSLVYAVKWNCRAELLQRIMYSCVNNKYDRDSEESCYFSYTKGLTVHRQTVIISSHVNKVSNWKCNLECSLNLLPLLLLKSIPVPGRGKP
jgi:hypothetical protein